MWGSDTNVHLKHSAFIFINNELKLWKINHGIHNHYGSKQRIIALHQVQADKHDCDKRLLVVVMLIILLSHLDIYLGVCSQKSHLSSLRQQMELALFTWKGDNYHKAFSTFLFSQRQIALHRIHLSFNIYSYSSKWRRVKKLNLKSEIIFCWTILKMQYLCYIFYPAY